VYGTLWKVLTEYCKALAPLIPFVTEEIYGNLTGVESVHLESWPEPGAVDEELEKEMELARLITEKTHAIRKEEKIKVRQPLATLSTTTTKKLSDDILHVLEEELNIKKVTNTIGEFSIHLDTTLTEDLKLEGAARDLIREIQDLRKQNKYAVNARVQITLPTTAKSLPPKLIEYIKKETLADAVLWGEKVSLSTG
jgi:isoleucyl-tRNA synthetase